MGRRPQCPFALAHASPRTQRSQHTPPASRVLTHSGVLCLTVLRRRVLLLLLEATEVAPKHLARLALAAPRLRSAEIAHTVVRRDARWLLVLCKQVSNDRGAHLQADVYGCVCVFDYAP